MAGDDEELSLLLSSIPDHSQEAEINNLLFSVQSMETGDMISQLLNSENFYTEDPGGQVVRDKERSVSLSVSSPESGVGSEELDMGAISPGAAWDMTPLSVEPSQTTGEQTNIKYDTNIISTNYIMCAVCGVDINIALRQMKQILTN